MFKAVKNRRNVLRSTDHYSLMQKGQVILEFTFCMIVIFIMIYGVIKVFHWAGRDVVERQRAHDDLLLGSTDPRSQIDPSFYNPKRMNAVFNKN